MPSFTPIVQYWLQEISLLGQSGRYIIAHPQVWPQSMLYQEEPIPMGLYGHASPFTSEDKMFLFDQMSRTQPISISLFYARKKPDLVDPFFCTFLANYLKIPCYLFEVTSHTKEVQQNSPYYPQQEQTLNTVYKTPSEQANSRHFQIIYVKKQILNQDKVKLRIKNVYGEEKKP